MVLNLVLPIVIKIIDRIIDRYFDENIEVKKSCADLISSTGCKNKKLNEKYEEIIVNQSRSRIEAEELRGKVHLLYSENLKLADKVIRLKHEVN